jgi:hypothetical protein
MKSKSFLVIILLGVSLIFSALPATIGQTTQVCEQCGMTVNDVSLAHFKVVDSNGNLHYAECMMCALKLLIKYDSLNITTNCDWYGPSSIITVIAKQHGSATSVNPPTAMVIAGGGCAKNRIVYNQTAVNAILANNGTSDYLAAIQKYVNGMNGTLVTVPNNSTVMSVAQAALQFGGGTPSPSPSSSPAPSLSPEPTASPYPSPSYSPVPTSTSLITPNSSPTSTPMITSSPEGSPKETQRPDVSTSPIQSPNSQTNTTTAPTPSFSPIRIETQTCEACGMEVNPAAQERYLITDGTGKVHYAECFMCALNLIKNYDQLHIVTSCDWYGPNYTITIDASQFGKVVAVSPTTAIFLNGGSCVINRAAYNQTAANELLTNGFSQYTLPNQQYALPSSTTFATVKDAVMKFSQNSPAQVGPASTSILILVAAIGIAVIAFSIVAFRKLKKQ